MTKETAIKLFEEKQVRVVWNGAQEKWYISIIDLIEILTAVKDRESKGTPLKPS